MRTIAQLTVIAIALLLCNAVELRAAPLPAELAEAFAKTPAVNVSQWRFRKTRVSDEETTVEIHDASQTPTWQLVSVNGEPPTEDDLAAHAERLERAAQEGQSEHGANDFESLARPDSWQLIEENASQSRWEFRPAPSGDMDEGMAKNVWGELTLDRSLKRIVSFRLFSKKPFRVRLVARIEEFETQIHMRTIAPGVEFAAKVVARVRGRAFGMKKFDETSTVTFDQFEFIGDDQANAEPAL